MSARTTRRSYETRAVLWAILLAGLGAVYFANGRESSGWISFVGAGIEACLALLLRRLSADRSSSGGTS